VRNPDILAELGRARAEHNARLPVLVGFAMETNDVVAYARKKLLDKRLDLIVANEAAVAFGRDDTQATLLTRDEQEPLPPMTKRELASRILDRIRQLLASAPRFTRSRRAQRPRARPPARRRKGRSRSTE